MEDKKMCEPFGEEWGKEMMKWRKDALVHTLRIVLKHIKLKNDSLKQIVNMATPGSDIHSIAETANQNMIEL